VAFLPHLCYNEDNQIPIYRAVELGHNPLAPSDEGAVTAGDWGRENIGIAYFFSPSGTSCHLPHQREAWVVRYLKQLDKSEFEEIIFNFQLSIFNSQLL